MVLPLQISFSTLACPAWGWHDVLANGVAYGYDGVEIRQLGGNTNLLEVPDLAESQWEERRRELESHRFRVAGLASSIKFDGDDLPAQLETGRRYLRLAAALGASFIRVFGDVLPSGDSEERTRAIDRIARGLNDLGKLAAPLGIDILLETHGDFTASPLAAAVMDRIDHERVGLVWDTHHPWRFHGEPLGESWQRLRRWTRHLHWKDSVQLASSHALTAEQQQAEAAARAIMQGHLGADYVLFGGGEFPAEECLRLVTQDGYSGWHSLEWEKMWHPQLTAPEVALPLFPIKLRQLARLVKPPSQP